MSFIEIEPGGLIAATGSAPTHASDEFDFPNGGPSGRVVSVLLEIQTSRSSVTDSKGSAVAKAEVSVRAIHFWADGARAARPKWIRTRRTPPCGRSP